MQFIKEPMNCKNFQDLVNYYDQIEFEAGVQKEKYQYYLKNPIFFNLENIFPITILQLCNDYSSFEICRFCNEWHPKLGGCLDCLAYNSHIIYLHESTELNNGLFSNLLYQELFDYLVSKILTSFIPSPDGYKIVVKRKGSNGFFQKPKFVIGGTKLSWKIEVYSRDCFPTMHYCHCFNLQKIRKIRAKKSNQSFEKNKKQKI